MKKDREEDTATDFDALGEGTAFLKGFALNTAPELLASIAAVDSESPFRHMVVPGSHPMSVAMTSCGLGWVTNGSGYRDTSVDPQPDKPWPAIPEVLLRVGKDSARAAGYINFEPDACLLIRYQVGARLSLHQDRNKDLSSPVVSISLGLSATCSSAASGEQTRPAESL